MEKNIDIENGFNDKTNDIIFDNIERTSDEKLLCDHVSDNIELKLITPIYNTINNPIHIINTHKEEVNVLTTTNTSTTTNIINTSTTTNTSTSWFEWIKQLMQKNKIDMYNKFLSITLHIFIMVVFEIYFYFNYVINIEKQAFTDKINAYFSELSLFNPNTETNPFINNKQIFNILLNSNQTEQQLNTLHEEYIESLNEQEQLHNYLLTKSCYMAGFIGLLLLIFFLNGIYNKKVIKWRWILVENILMLLLLGLFEYLFFINIIMNYNPISDAEIKYMMVKGMVNYFNQSMNQ